MVTGGRREGVELRADHVILVGEGEIGQVNHKIFRVDGNIYGVHQIIYSVD